MKVFNNIKDGLKMGKDKAAGIINGIGAALKNKETRFMIGITATGLGVALMMSCYIKVPQ